MRILFSILLLEMLILISCTGTKTSTENKEVQKNNSPYGITKHRITSKVLDYDLQYWVQLPEGYNQDMSYPSLYVTDGVWYKVDGRLPTVAAQLMEEEKISNLIIVYVDAIHPDLRDFNRRNGQFLCNPKYVEFYRQELIPEIDKRYATDQNRETRGILGLSFGGLNSMYFGIHANDLFGKIGIQSPAPHPCPAIYDEYINQPVLPIDIFLSTGTVNDKEISTRRLKKILEDKGYDFGYVEVAEGHNWANWAPLLDDVLLRFYGKK